jgi:hypothetical protein
MFEMSTHHALSDAEIKMYYTQHQPNMVSKLGGILSKGELIDHKVEHKFYILNLDKPSGAGTHWVLLYCVNPKGVVYFDPFGSPPSQQVNAFVHPFTKDLECIYEFSDDVVQDERSSMCGYYCMYVSTQLFKGRSLYSIMKDDFGDNSRQNDQKMVHHFSKSTK